MCRGRYLDEVADETWLLILHHLHLRPWEFEHLTVAQFLEAVDQAEKLNTPKE